MSTMTDGVWLNVARAGERAGVSTATIMRAARRGDLTGYKVGFGKKLWRFRPQDIDAWIMTGSTPVEVTPPSSAPVRRPTISERGKTSTLG
jgi:excisionase family DNA binding protein